MTSPTPPATVLLATDLTPRSDRALERSAQLANEWQAELTALHVLEKANSPDQVLAWASGGDDSTLQAEAQLQLGRDLADLACSRRLMVARADSPADSIRQVASDHHCGLIVVGATGNDTFGRFFPGSVVERLAGAVPLLLVVRNRVHGPYQRIVVASDFSSASGQALRQTSELFAGRELTLYHAYPLPASGNGKRDNNEIERQLTQQTLPAFLTASGLPNRVIIKPVLENGVLESMLAHYVRRHAIDLVVMGSRGSGGMMNMLLGRSATKLLDWLPCDLLIVGIDQAT